MAGVFCVQDPSSILPESRVRAAHHDLDYRGADGAELVSVGDVHLGHQHFWTTPESEGEVQPLATKGVWISLDGRIDDRAALVRNLYGPAFSGTPSDAQLLLDAYRTYGIEFLDHVVGVCSFVLYDHPEDRLLAVRDRVGLRELFFGRYRDAVIVASDRTPVVTCRGGRANVNERKLAEYVEETTFTPSITVYEEVTEIPPGHYAIVEDGTVDLREYWRPTETPLAGTETEILSTVLATCRDAVEARLRSRGPAATELSGGLDSTTVSALAREVAATDRRVASYSLVFSGVGGEELTVDERQRMADVAERHDLDHHEIVADELGPLAETSYYEPFLLEGPAINGMMNAFRALYERARGDGCAVLLSGEGGHLFDGRQTIYVDLLRQGKVRAAVEKLREDGTSYPKLAWFLLVKLYASIGGRFPDRRDFGLDTVLSERFISRVAAERYDWPTHPQARYDLLVNQDNDRRTFHSQYLELLNFNRRVALAHGVDVWHPLLDSRVVDLLYSLPKELLIREGRYKHVLRAIGDEYLPASVAEAELTPSFTPLYTTGLRAERETVEARFEQSRLVERGYISAGDLDEIVDAFYRSAPTDGDYGAWSGISQRHVWRLFTTEEWLRELEREGVVD